MLTEKEKEIFMKALEILNDKFIEYDTINEELALVYLEAANNISVILVKN